MYYENILHEINEERDLIGAINRRFERKVLGKISRGRPRMKILKHIQLSDVKIIKRWKGYQRKEESGNIYKAEPLVIDDELIWNLTWGNTISC